MFSLNFVDLITVVDSKYNIPTSNDKDKFDSRDEPTYNKVRCKQEILVMNDLNTKRPNDLF